jgi:TonB family protein
MGNYENAAQDYSEAIQLNPERQDYYAKRARIYRYAKQIELAEADERKLKEMQDASDELLPPNPGEITGAVLNDKAVNLPKPDYPSAARAVRAGGEVKVKIEVDGKGNVLSAKAVSGHPLLHASAESAARAAKFNPAARTGILIFNYTA